MRTNTSNLVRSCVPILERIASAFRLRGLRAGPFLILLSVVIATVPQSAEAVITLSGFELYTSTATGSYNPPYGGYRYTSNSNDLTANADALTKLGAPSQTTAIQFPLSLGLNTFAFQLDPTHGNGKNVDPQAFAGVNLFFSGDGSSYNPNSMGIASNLTGFVPTNGGTFQFPAAGVLVQDYGPYGLIGPGPTFTPEPYSGAHSFTIGGQTVTITALSINHTPSGSLTLNVVPEPASLGLMAFASFGLLARRTSRLRRASIATFPK